LWFVVFSVVLDLMKLLHLTLNTSEPYLGLYDNPT
jgi:hypothetical protein